MAVVQIRKCDVFPQSTAQPVEAYRVVIERRRCDQSAERFLQTDWVDLGQRGLTRVQAKVNVGLAAPSVGCDVPNTWGTVSPEDRPIQETEHGDETDKSV